MGIEWSRGERALSAGDWARQVVAVIIGGASRVVTVPSQAAQAPRAWPDGREGTARTSAPQVAARR